MLYSSGQLRIEKDGDTEKGCQKPDEKQKTTKLNLTIYSYYYIIYYYYNYIYIILSSTLYCVN